MIVIYCIDDNFGMMFNLRRQSQDKYLREHLLQISKDGVLKMNSYSFKQFSDHDTKNIVVDENFISNTDENSFCFVENISVDSAKSKIKKIILFKWNRVYPADFYFDKSILQNFTLINSFEFNGNSHEIITREDWIINE